MKRLVICTGGTAGHLFPAQALAEELLSSASPPDILFLGHGLASNRFFDRDRFSYEEVNAAPFRPSGLLPLLRGYRKARALLSSFAPDLAVGFGSYHALPPLLAARRRKVPVVLHEANAYPGRVVRLLSPYAEVTGLHFEGAGDYLRGRSEVVGMPVRRGCRLEARERDLLLRDWQLEPQRTTLLIFGGSQGAHRINELVEGAAERWKGRPFQVIHFTGDATTADRVRRRYRELGLLCYVRSFEPEMERAWRCADFVISRAGASSLAEQRLWAVPGLLIPYPYAADRHQEYNARHMEQLGGAVVLSESSLSSEGLARVVEEVIEGPKLDEMRRKLKAHPVDPPDQFARLVQRYLIRESV